MAIDSNSALLNIDRLTATSIPSSQFEDPNLLGIAPRASSLASPITSRLAALSTSADIDIEVIGANWVAQGPSPATNGQTENVRLNGEANTVAATNQVVGAIHTVVAHPTDSNTLWVGAVNGGIWRTNTANQANPTWTPLTDQFRGLSIGAMALDPTDTDPQGDGLTIIAGTGRFSSYNLTGGPLTGLLLSTDGGDIFQEIRDPLLQGLSISGIAMRGNTILVGANNFGSGSRGGVYRGTNNGGTWNWNQIPTTTGLDAGAAFDLVGDPTDNQRFYVSVQSVGIFRSNDSGVTWNNVSQGDANLNAGIRTVSTAPDATNNTNTEMSVSQVNGRIYIGVIRDNRPVYIGFSDNQGTNWTEMDLPVTLDNDPEGDNGLSPRAKPGAQGYIHFSIVADPTNQNIVYVGGDRQPGPRPNSIGATTGSGRLFRGDTGQPANAPGAGGNVTDVNRDGTRDNNDLSRQWQPLTHRQGGFTGGGTANSSAPHADSREMTFDANGDLIEVDDGGIYRRTRPRVERDDPATPQNELGDWFSLNGNLQITEQHDIAYDTTFNILISGNQDNGTTQQTATNSQLWNWIYGGDGGDVAVWSDPNNPTTQSVRYYSSQNLGLNGGARGLVREVFSNSPTGVQTSVGLTGFDFDTDGRGPDTGDEQFRTPIAINPFDVNRLIVGGRNRVYESINQGNSVAVIQAVDPNNIDPSNGQPTPVPNVGVGEWMLLNPPQRRSDYGSLIAYGGRRNGQDQANVLYIGSDETGGSNHDLYVRSDTGTTLERTAYRNISNAGSVRGISLDNEDWQTAFVIDENNVFQTINAGANWTDITGDLFDSKRFSNLDLNRFANPLGTGDYLVSVEFVSSPTLDALVVGTTQGVFASLSNNWSDWFAVGPATQPNAAQTRLPHVPVWDMDFDAADNLLAVGTLGRGAWTINNINTVINSAPRPNGGTSYDVNEGSSVVLSASGSSDPNGLALTYTWDLDSDGIFGETGLGAIRGNEVGLNPTFSAAELDGPRNSRTVKLRVTNSEGSSAVDKNIRINVKNVAPQINGITLSSTVINENDTITLTGSFIDPGIPDTHTVTVNWGDGTTSNLSIAQARLNRSFQLSHQYLDDTPTGTPSDLLPITVTILDNDGGSAQASTAIRVNNIAPVITSFTSTANFADRARADKPITINANFTDIGTLDTHRAFIDWGDGTPTQEVTIFQGSGSGAVQGSHSYAKGGAFTVKLTLNDDDTGTNTASLRTIIIGTGLGPG